MALSSWERVTIQARDSSVLLQYVPFSSMVALHFFLWLTIFFSNAFSTEGFSILIFFPRANSVELVNKQMRGRESVPAGLWKGIYLFQLANHNSGSIFNTMTIPHFSLMHEGLGTYMCFRKSLCALAFIFRREKQNPRISVPLTASYKNSASLQHGCTLKRIAQNYHWKILSLSLVRIL